MLENYEKNLNDWLKKQYEATGRFDQKAITKEAPLPYGPSKLEALIIMSTMVSAARKVPALAHEISLDAPESDKPWKLGRIWCEYENACLTLEMSNIQRNNGEWDRGIARSMLAYLSHTLNVKYGIDRSANSVKNQWYRELRARSGIDERGNFGSPDAKNSRHGTSMRVSLTDVKKAKAKAKSKGKLTYVPGESSLDQSSSPLIMKKSGIIVKFSTKK